MNNDNEVKENIEKIIQEYLKDKLSIKTEPDIYVDNRYKVSILLNGEEIDYDYIDF
jgi:hypothetical protein